jgi:hypothetical protein
MHLLAAASSDLFLQILGAVVGGVLVAAIVALWHRGRRLLIKFEGVVEKIGLFGEQWTAATVLADTIKATAKEAADLKAQLGTADRKRDWIALEEYLHEWRHDQRNQQASLELIVHLLQNLITQTTPQPASDR